MSAEARRDSPLWRSRRQRLWQPRRPASGAGGRASGRGPPSPQRSWGERRARRAGAEEWAGPAWLGAGRRGKAGSRVASARVRLWLRRGGAMCDYHGEESLSGDLAKETLLPPGRPAASPPRALPRRAGLACFPPPPLDRRPLEPRCPLPSGTWRRAFPAARTPQPPRRRCPRPPLLSQRLLRPGRPDCAAGSPRPGSPPHPKSPGTWPGCDSSPLAVGAGQSGLGTCLGLLLGPVPFSLVGPAGSLFSTLCPESSVGSR